jgi:hypothetical protein
MAASAAIEQTVRPSVDGRIDTLLIELIWRVHYASGGGKHVIMPASA